MVTRPSIQEARGCLSSSVEFCRGSCDSTGASTALFADVQQVRLETIMHMQTVVDGVVSLAQQGGRGRGYERSTQEDVAGPLRPKASRFRVREGRGERGGGSWARGIRI